MTCDPVKRLEQIARASTALGHTQVRVSLADLRHVLSELATFQPKKQTVVEDK